MCRKWFLLPSATCIALFIALVWASLVPSTALAMVNAGGVQGAAPSTTNLGAYREGYQQGYRAACSNNGMAVQTVPSYPAVVGPQTYNGGYQQGYQTGSSACSSPALGGYGTPGAAYGAAGSPYGPGGAPYGVGGAPYGNYGGYGNPGYAYPPGPVSGYSSPDGSYTPAYGSNNAPLFNIQTNITVSGNH